MTKSDTVIIGGGVAGLALAVLLADAGMTCVLADAGAAPAPLADIRPDGRTVAMMGASMDTLTRVGVWPALQPYASPLARMAVIDDSRFPAGGDNMVEQMFDAYELGRDAFGWNVPLGALRAALYAQVKKRKNITCLWHAGFDTATQTANGITVRLQGQKSVDAQLLIGADGRESPVRKLAGITAKRHAYGQKALTCLISHSRPHDDTSVEFHRSGGPFTYVPLPDNHCSIVWVEKDADADALLKLNKQALTKALSDRTRGRLGTIELVSNAGAWPLEFLRAEKLTAPRMALAAEAAHVISPIGAQGLNLSLRDITGLADTIIQAKAVGLDIGASSVLARYEKQRRGDVISRSLTIDAVNQAVANDSPAIRALRRMALRALSLPGPWRTLAMKKGLAA